ncbi:NAD(P)H-dependent oxidoreductase [Serratia ureilytica]
MMRGNVGAADRYRRRFRQACAPDRRDGARLMLWPIMHALHYIGFSVLEPFLVYGVRGGLTGEALQAQNAALAQVTQAYRAGLGDLAACRRCGSTAMKILTPIWR